MGKKIYSILKRDWKKELAVTFAGALLFAAVSYPFTLLSNFFVISQVRPAAVLNPCLGFVFGPAGALGCALGNFAVDYVGMGSSVAFGGFLFQLFYGLIPWLLLKLFPIDREQKQYYRFTGVKSVLYFYLAVSAGCLFIAGIVPPFFAEEGKLFSMFFFMLLNNIAMNFVFAVPLVLLLVRLKRCINRIPPTEHVSICEKLMVFFMLSECGTILLVGAISWLLVRESRRGLEMWNSVFISVFAAVLFFTVVQFFFMEMIEKKILKPLNSLAGVWKKDRTLAVDMCNRLYQNKSEIGAFACAFLALVDEIQINVMKLSTAKLSENGVSDISVLGDCAKMYFSGCLEEREAEDLAINLFQIPQNCRVLKIDTEKMTFMTGEVLRLLSEFMEKRKNVRVVMTHVGESTKMILDITGFSGLIEIE